MSQIGHWIAGNSATGSSKRFGDVFDPALGVVTKQVAFATVPEVQ